MFYWQKHRRRDADLHEPILAAGDHRTAEAVGDAVAKRIGLTEEEINALSRRR